MNIEATDAAITLRSGLRDRLAEQMAAFEAERGAIRTSPIRIGDPPQRAFRISNPDKPKPAKQSVTARRPKTDAAQLRARLGTQQGRNRALLAQEWS
jgi:hypothetical protein